MANAEERERVAAFVDALYESGGFSSWGEFARESGLLASTISDYKRGENSPSGPNLLRLIDAATAREATALQRAGARVSPLSQLRTRLEEIAEQADEGRVALADALEGIRLSLARIEARLPPQAEPGQEAAS